MTFFTKLEYLYLLLVTLDQLHQGCVGYDPEASITGLYTGPYFDPLAPRNLTAHLDDRAVLPCTVRQLGDKSVSWVRMRDADILTVDRYTFVSDERFEAHYSPPQETWNLVIKYVQERDAGQYECQVSTEPKMSQLFNLRVVVPRVSMDPPGDRYVKAGSKVRIDCQITDVVQQPDYIFWYHDGVRVLEHEDTNLQVNVKKTGEESLVSTLIISRVRRDESGNYTCMPSNLHASSILLHVLNEEHPEAMKDGRNASCKMEQPIYLFLLFVLCTILKRLFNDGSIPNQIIEEETKNSVVKRRCQLAFGNGETSETSVDKVIERGEIEGNRLRLLVEFFRKLNQHMAKKSVEKIGFEEKISPDNMKSRTQNDLVKMNLYIQKLINNCIFPDEITNLGMKMILKEIEHYLPNEQKTDSKVPNILIEWHSEWKQNLDDKKNLHNNQNQIIQNSSQVNINLIPQQQQQLWTPTSSLSCSHISSVKMIKFR